MLGAAALTLTVSGCTSPSAALEEHAEKLRSIRATTALVSEAWTAGELSGTFARVALEQAFQLLQKERAAIAPTATALANPAAAALARDSDELERRIAALVRDIETSNRTPARRRLVDARASTPDRR